jgi:hypothetical protein
LIFEFSHNRILPFGDTNISDMGNQYYGMEETTDRMGWMKIRGSKT